MGKPFMGLLKVSLLRNLFVVTALLGVVVTPAEGDPVRTRHPEGEAHGVLVLTDIANDPLAYGELIQWEERRGSVASRLRIRFKDGSVYDEVVRYSQRPVLRLLSYQLTQLGPSFTETSEIFFDRTGRYNARVQEAGKAEAKASGSMSIPEDVSNGMTSLVLKNLPPGASGIVHFIAFTPKPQLLELELSPEGTDQLLIGSAAQTVTRFLMQPKVPGMKGVVATAVGKQPQPFRMWLTPEPAPALLKFEGPLYADGPIWRISPTSPKWKE
jgi:hypothetical protein